MKEPIYTPRQIRLIFATSLGLWIPLGGFLYFFSDKLTEMQVLITTGIVLPVLVLVLFLISDRWIRNLK